MNEFTISSTSASIGLCKEHYARLYSYLHPSIPCESCSAKPKQWENFTRHCPSPNIVNGYLSHISNEKSTLTASSTICYKYFQSIVQQIGTHTSSALTHDLDTIGRTLMQQIHFLKLKGQSIHKEEFYEMTMCKAANTLLTTVKCDEAMLLSKLYQAFCVKIQLDSSIINNIPPCSVQKKHIILRVGAGFCQDFTQSLVNVCKHDRYLVVTWSKHYQLHLARVRTAHVQ